MNQSARILSCFIAFAFVILAGRHTVFATSFVFEFASASTRMQSNMVLAYNDPGGLYSESLDASGVIAVDPHVAPEFHANSAPTNLYPPSSSESQDFISGHVDLEFSLGGPVTGANQNNDRILFITRGNLGAVDASGHTGPLTGHVHSYAMVELPVEVAAGAQQDDPVGTFVVSEITIPEWSEAEVILYEVSYTEEGTPSPQTIVAWLPLAGWSYDLLAGYEYWIQFEFEANVPAGSAISYDIVIGVDLLNTWGIPEPATIGPMMIGLVYVSLARRRRAFHIYCRDSIPGGTR